MQKKRITNLGKRKINKNMEKEKRAVISKRRKETGAKFNNASFIIFILLPVLIILMILINIQTASASGCCFAPEDGLCTMNSEEARCTELGGEFSDSSTCSISKCNKGCCILGANAVYATARACEVQSKAFGFEENFQITDEKSCFEIAASQEKGACVLRGEYESACKFTTREQCTSAGEFHAGALCSTAELNTTCKKTTKTMCYDEDVHYKDSCENPDALKDNCDYTAGTICRTKSKNEAYCKSLNCEGGKKNGESWCVDLSGEGAVGLKSITGKTTWITGMDTGVTGSAIIRDGNLVCDTSWDICNENMCQRCIAEVKKLGGGSDRVKGCVFGERCGGGGEEGEGSGGGTSTPVGSRFFRQYCLNGEIFTEPCADFRMESCSTGGESEEAEGEESEETATTATPGNAKCTINPWEECLGANGEEVDEETGSKVDEESCDGEYCYVFEVGGISCTKATDTTAYKETGTWCYNPDGTATVYQENSARITSAQGGPKYYPSSFLNIEEVEKPDPLLANLHLEMCLPKIPGGLQFYPSAKSSGGMGGGSAGETSSAEATCAMGNYESTIKFESINKLWYLQLDEGKKDYYYNVGLLDTDDTKWKTDDADEQLESIDEMRGESWTSFTSGNTECSRKNPFLNYCKEYESFEGWKIWNEGYIQDIYDGKRNQLPLNGKVVEILNSRCAGIGDCDGKVNWVGIEGGSVAEDTQILCTYSADEITCPFSFECKPFEAPSGSKDCKKCGSDGLPCTEYRCEALGHGCDYFEPAGADKGYCVASKDFSYPRILGYNINPPSPIPPFTAASINLTTNEIAECRFSMNSSSVFDNMKYSLGKGWGTEHNVVLNLPGQRFEIENTSSSYSLINKDGIYTMHVRCKDVAGNFNIAAYPIRFEVMKTPDTIPPVIIEFAPASGSAIKYNTTSKEIRFRLNEPAECKWDNSDRDYNVMKNNFSCDTGVSDYGVLNGYWCAGTFNNVTKDIQSSTKFYIRCKDQPWIENDTVIINGVSYSRNTNTRSKEYVLKASSALEITELTPRGEIKKSSADTSAELKAITSGGGANGVAKCRWKLLSNTTFDLFKNTNAKTHTQRTSNLSDGAYTLNVKCEDESENKVEGSSSFTLRIDRDAPRVVRAYNSEGVLKVMTNEDSQCKFTDKSPPGCAFNFDSGNATAMAGAGREHTTEWIAGRRYFVRCRDIYGNENSGCGIIVRTY